MVQRKSSHLDDCPMKGLITPPPTPANSGTVTDQSGFNAHIEGRVGRLEGAVENLTHEVQETSRAVRGIADGLGKFKEDVIGHIGQATAPKWPLIVSFVMIALTIITLVGTVVTQNMSGQSAAIAKVAGRLDMMDEHALVQANKEGEHKAWREMIDQKTTKLDTDLQREMRLINETTDSKLQANDKATLAKLAELQAQVADIKQWRLSHVSESAKTVAELQAKVEGAIKVLEHIEHRQYDDRVNRMWMQELKANKLPADTEPRVKEVSP